MSDNRPLCVKVQMTDGEMGETITETVVIRPAEGEDKLQILNEQANEAVRDATRKMNKKYGEPEGKDLEQVREEYLSWIDDE